MTVSSEISKSGPYVCNGVTTTFPYGFRILDKAHIRVVLADAEGVETDLDLDVDFTVTGVGDASGGDIVVSPAPAAGKTITNLRKPPFTQETDLQNQGAYYAQTVEDRFDMITMQIQTVKERSDRSVALPASDTTDDLDGLITDIRVLASDIDELLAAAETTETKADQAAVSAAAARNSVAALAYSFASATADADPGPGLFRLNNLNPALATAIYIDNVDADGLTMGSVIDTWDDSTNTVRGQLTIRSMTDASIRRVYNVTGSVVDGTGYRKLTLAYVGGAGTLEGACFLIFSATGSAGSVSGPGASVIGRIATFANTGGTSIQDSGVLLTALALLASPAFTGAVSITNTAAGTALTIESSDASGSGGPDLVLSRNSASPAANDLLSFIIFRGRDSAANLQTFGQIYAQITDPTNGSEDGVIVFETAVAGAVAGRLTIGAGVFTPNVSGGDKGAGTINSALYDSGYRVSDAVLASGTLAAAASLVIDLSAHIAAGFSEFSLRIKNFVPATDNVLLYLTFSINAGSSFISSGYKTIYTFGTPAPAPGASGSNSASQITVLASCGNAAGEFVTAELNLALGAVRAAMTSDITTVSQAADTVTVSGGGVLDTANVNAIRLAFSAGNIASGTWTLIGKRSS